VFQPNFLPKDLDIWVWPITAKYVPEWFPGAGFKRYARRAKKLIDDLSTLPFQHVKESFQVRERRLSSGKIAGRRILEGHYNNFVDRRDLFRRITRPCERWSRRGGD